MLEKTRYLSVAELAQFFQARKSVFTAVHESEGDLGEVEDVLDCSGQRNERLEVRLKSGRMMVFAGTTRERPVLGDEYFWIVPVFPKTGDIKPEGSKDQAYDKYSEVRAGTVPKHIEILGGGYASLSGEPSMPSPRDPSLTLTLVDQGAESHNRPILERAVAQRRYELERDHVERRLAARQKVREYESFVSGKQAEIRALFEGGSVMDVKPLFEDGPYGRQVIGVKLVLSDGHHVTVSHEDRNGLVFHKD